jgi:hypothetical protein
VARAPGLFLPSCEASAEREAENLATDQAIAEALAGQEISREAALRQLHELPDDPSLPRGR